MLGAATRSNPIYATHRRVATGGVTNNPSPLCDSTCLRSVGARVARLKV